MAVPIYQVDAFTAEPFKGNPAGVCLLDEPAEADWMQAVAAEMNLSETAFVHPEGDGFRLRWFTPAVEVKLCGHATLATSHILWETGRLGKNQTARYSTLSGLLTARLEDGLIELDFPARPAKAGSPAWASDLAGAIGVKPHYIGLSAEDVLVEVADEETVRNLDPDLAAIKDLPIRGVIATARSLTAEYDFVSRFFAPAVGVDEDPVTGSSHCVLVPYWARKLGKNVLSAYQASKRSGELRLKLAGDRVIIGGQAVTVIEGHLKAG